MIPSYEQVGDWLEEISAGFPDAFFDQLDGGIQLEEEALPDPEFPLGEMYIMGEYCHDLLGRYIVLYYGSFAALLAEEDEETWKDELFATVAHEFTHHMEETAGLHALDDQDAEFLRRAREEYGAGRPCLFHTKNEAAVPWGQQPHLLWILWEGGFSVPLQLARQAGTETGVPPGLAVVGHHAGHGLIVSHQDQQILGPGDGSV